MRWRAAPRRREARVSAEDRAAQRNLLVARAMLERAQLLQTARHAESSWKVARCRAPDCVGSRSGSLRGRSWLGVALSAVHLLRSHPVLVPLVTVASRLVRGRGWRWLLVAGVVGAVAWSLQRPSRGADDTADNTAGDAPAPTEGGSV